MNIKLLPNRLLIIEEGDGNLIYTISTYLIVSFRNSKTRAVNSSLIWLKRIPAGGVRKISNRPPFSALMWRPKDAIALYALKRSPSKVEESSNWAMICWTSEWRAFRIHGDTSRVIVTRKQAQEI